MQLLEEHTTATRCSSFPSLGSFFQTTMHRINSLNTALVAHTIQHTSATSVPCCNLGGPITYSAELIPWQGSLHTPHGRWKIKILIFPVQHSGYSIAGNSNWSTPSTFLSLPNILFSLVASVFQHSPCHSHQLLAPSVSFVFPHLVWSWGFSCTFHVKDESGQIP